MTDDQFNLILDRLNSIDRRLEMLELIAMKANAVPEPVVVHGTLLPETMWIKSMVVDEIRKTDE